MKYHKTELWKHHPKANLPRKVKLRETIKAVVLTIAGYGLMWWVLSWGVLPSTGDSINLWDGAQIGGFFAGVIIAICGWVTFSEISSPTEAEDTIRHLAFALCQDPDPEKFAQRSVNDIRESGHTVLLSIAADIRMVEEGYKTEYLKLSLPEMKNFLAVAVEQYKSNARSRMDRLYNALLEFRLAPSGGLDQYFKIVEKHIKK